MLGLIIYCEGRFVGAPVFDQRTLKIGRSSSCDIRLDEDPGISAMHALIELRGPPSITDLGSAAGTRVNGEPVAKASLEAGDTIAVGAHVLTIIALTPEPSAATARVEVVQTMAAACARTASMASSARRWAEAQAMLAAGWGAVEDPQWLGLMQELGLLGDAPPLAVDREASIRRALANARGDERRLWLDADGLRELAGLRRVLLSIVRERAEASGAAIWEARAMELEIGLNPDDDAPRQVYADWLLERGDPRGEFIALQLLTADDPDGPQAAREAELWRLHGSGWSSAYADFGAQVEFRRGFPSRVRYDGFWPEELIALVRDTPTLEQVEGGLVPQAVRAAIPGPGR